jgi:Na+/H+ antiporter NhaA
MTPVSQSDLPATSGTSVWSWRNRTALRRFLSTEAGSSVVLLCAALVALVWANVAGKSYEAFWHSELSVTWGDHGISMSAVEWINSGLMAFYFFVVGLEARREFDVGDLRERRRVLLPVVAGLGGMLVSVLIYLAVTTSGGGAHGWGVALSTDTAIALGLLALVGPRYPAPLRAFLLTVVITDDLVALVAIATVYTDDIKLVPLLLACLLFAITVVAVLVPVQRGFVYLLLGLATWVALDGSGVDPVVIGLALGLLTYARPVAQERLSEATDSFRDFREQPTSSLARSARASVRAAVPPNERLQELYHPWTSYVIVPLFALANAGIVINGEFLAAAVRSPITWGVVAAFVVGKPAGILGGSWLVTRLSGGRVRPPVGWASVVGSGTLSGIGFTLSLLIATLAFRGPELQEAKLGVLAAAVISAGLTWVAFRVTAALPAERRVRALLGGADSIIDLAEPVDPERDHVRGPEESLVTLVEYGDFECPYCGQAEPIVRELLADFGDLRYVWRHLPLRDVHPNAQLAAEASEAAARQEAFWEMHDVLMAHQDALRMPDLVRYADELGLDVPAFTRELQRHEDLFRVAEDIDSADLSGVRGTPTFFVNGLRHHGEYDIASLTEAIRLAKARAVAGR